jgi:NAD(P)-dependent dehydrogenase (short-subunit alcohol dehydrogenase family)
MSTSDTTIRWNADMVGDQHGRTVVITGGNSGIGLETAKVFAARGATVLLTYRNSSTASAAVDKIAAVTPDATVTTRHLDLASLASVRETAEWIRTRYPRLDLLINNAGVMMTPFGTTQDGFELQLGSNHLGHFALTGLLLDALVGTPGSRVVTVSSAAHRQGRIDLDDLHFGRRRYRPSTAYGQSKLANILFTQELNRRLASAGAETIALAVEPGFVPTDLGRHVSGPVSRTMNIMVRLIGQPDAAAGALPTLRAATDPQARGGDYYAPDGRMMRTSGHPVRIKASAAAYDLEVQQRLWSESERLTGVSYPLAGLTSPQTG